MKKQVFAPLALLLAALLAGCSFGPGGDQPATLDPNQPVSSDDTPVPPTTRPDSGEVVRGGPPYITFIDVLILESFPVQVMANIKGDLPDGCTTIAETTATRDGNTFTIEMATQRPADAMCTEALVAFEQNVSLDVYGLPAGEYTVVVYEHSATFTLAVDNVPPEDAGADPTMQCAIGDDGAILITHDDAQGQLGYCFLIPEGFSPVQDDPNNPNPPLVVVGPARGAGPEPPRAVLSIEMEPSDDRTADDAITEVAGGVAVVKMEVLLGSTPATAVLGASGLTDTRVVVVERNGWILRLYFSPLDANAQPEAAADMETLYAMVLGSWVFFY